MALCVAVLLSSHTRSKVKEYNRFVFTYVDNSRIFSGDGVNKKMLSLLQQNGLKHQNNSTQTKYLLFLSNGLTPTVSTSPNEINSIITQISEGYYDAPSFTDDRKAIRKSLQNELFVAKGEIVINYFVTRSFAEKITFRQPQNLGNLISELILYCQANNETQYSINIYFPKVKGMDKKLKKTLLEKVSLLNTALNTQIGIHEIP